MSFLKNIVTVGLPIICLSQLNLVTKVQAGGCFSTTPDGACVKWDNTKDVVWNFDAGPLKGPPEEANGGSAGGSSGCQVAKPLDVPNSEAVAMVERAFKRWTDVPNSKLNVVKGTALLGGEDINFTNIEKVYAAGPSGFVFPQNAPSEVDAAGCYDNDAGTPCFNPIIFDHSGLVTQAINGQGAQCSILGFAAILPKTSGDGTILDPLLRSSQAVVSGACLEPRVIDPSFGDCCPKNITVANVEGTMTHELGHFLGLDHTLTNKDRYWDCCVSKLNADKTASTCPADQIEDIPTMIGLFCPGMDFNTLHQDDKSTFATLYPAATFAAQTCKITGIARKSDNSHQRCLEVVARRAPPDGLGVEEREGAVSTVSGAFSKRFSQGFVTESRTDKSGKNVVNCDEAVADECGRYTIEGLPPGNYVLSVQDFDAQPGVTETGQGENINFVLEPCTPNFASDEFEIQPGVFLPGYGAGTGLDVEDAGIPAGSFSCPAGGTVNRDVKMGG